MCQRTLMDIKLIIKLKHGWSFAVDYYIEKPNYYWPIQNLGAYIQNGDGGR